MPIFVHSRSRKKDWLLNFFEEGGNHMTKCKVIALANQKGGTAYGKLHIMKSLK